MTSGDRIVLVYSTYPSSETAQAAAHQLIAARLAACVNLLPGMTAIYQWQGEIHEDGEIVLLAKTSEALSQEVMQHISSNHPYETPAVLVIPMIDVAPGFKKWIISQTGQTVAEEPRPGKTAP